MIFHCDVRLPGGIGIRINGPLGAPPTPADFSPQHQRDNSTVAWVASLELGKISRLDLEKRLPESTFKLQNLGDVVYASEHSLK